LERKENSMGRKMYRSRVAPLPGAIAIGTDVWAPVAKASLEDCIRNGDARPGGLVNWRFRDFKDGRLVGVMTEFYRGEIVQVVFAREDMPLLPPGIRKSAAAALLQKGIDSRWQ
jgi:hypothetical protein